jgi:glutamate synthase (NADPH/NADH) small chain
MDAARCALRLGSENVYIVYRRSIEEMPARKEEIDHAKEEGVTFKLLNSPVRFVGDEKGCLTSMVCTLMELGEPDDSGRRHSTPIEDSEFLLDVDTVIIAVGTSPNPLIRKTTSGLDINRRGCIVANDGTGLTSREGVYAGGDTVTGAATVILAMGAGKKAAIAMDEYMNSH